MQSSASTVKAYLDTLPPDRKKAIAAMRNTIRKHLPKGFKEGMYYGMIGYVVPHSLYPKGYHCNPEQPLPFINLASQKQYISFYHMGLYDKKLVGWLTTALSKLDIPKPGMGKCCIRFKKMEHIPLELIGEMCEKITPQQWIETYERSVKRK